jgi:uncharacterized protein YueI
LQVCLRIQFTFQRAPRLFVNEFMFINNKITYEQLRNYTKYGGEPTAAFYIVSTLAKAVSDLAVRNTFWPHRCA